MDKSCVARDVIMRIAAGYGCTSQADIVKRIEEKENVRIQHQKFSLWYRGKSAFPNDFAEIFSRALGLTDDEQIELALALSFGQKSGRLLKPAAP